MDGKQGIQLVQLISPKLTIPIHTDDYDVFLVSRQSYSVAVQVEIDVLDTGQQSPRSDFEKEVTNAGFDSKVLYLERGDVFEFGVRT